MNSSAPLSMKMNAPPAMRLGTKHLMRRNAPPLMKPSARPLIGQNTITSAQPPMNKNVPQVTRQPMNSSAPHKQPIMNSARARLVLLMEAMVLPSVSKCQVYRRVVTRFLYRSHLKTVNKSRGSRASRLPSKCLNSNALKNQSKTAHKCQSKKQSKYPNKAATRYPRNIARVFQLSKQSCNLEGFPRKYAAMVDQVEDTMG